jgi:hypothetical protein
MLRLLIVTCAAITVVGTSFAKAEKDKSIEMSALFNLFLMPSSSNESLGWETGASPDSPIDWETSGKNAKDKECSGADYCRIGSAVVTVNNKITHTVLEKNTRPGRWVIALTGSHIGVEKISILGDDIMHDEAVDVPTILEKAKIKFSLLKCPNEPGSAGNVLYKIQAPGKREALLINEWSCGSGGCRFGITISHGSVEELVKMQCFADL